MEKYERQFYLSPLINSDIKKLKMHLVPICEVNMII